MLHLLEGSVLREQLKDRERKRRKEMKRTRRDSNPRSLNTVLLSLIWLVVANNNKRNATFFFATLNVGFQYWATYLKHVFDATKIFAIVFFPCSNLGEACSRRPLCFSSSTTSTSCQKNFKCLLLRGSSLPKKERNSKKFTTDLFIPRKINCLVSLFVARLSFETEECFCKKNVFAGMLTDFCSALKSESGLVT